MNSNSIYNYNDDSDSCRRDKRKEKMPCPTIIKCGAPGSATLPLGSIVGTTVTPASLTLNTSCLCNPCTKLEFTSNIITTLFTGAVSFQVFKQCRNQLTPVPVGPSFTFSRLVEVGGADTFTFFICDCDSCDNDCCTYTVVATVTTIIAGTLLINNATLGAIATCQTNPCNC